MQALTGAYLAVRYKPAEYRIAILFLMNSVELLYDTCGENSKGSPQVSHSFKHKWKLVTISNSCPQDKNPPSTVCWRGQWLKEQAPPMSTNLLLMGERGKKREKIQMNEKTNEPGTMQRRPCFRNILQVERETERQSLGEPQLPFVPVRCMLHIGSISCLK